MAGNRPGPANPNASSSLPNKEAISSLFRRVYSGMTELSRERLEDNGENSWNAEEELSRRFQIPRGRGDVSA